MFRTGGGYLMDPGQRRDGLSGSYRMFGVRPDPYRDQNREYYAAVLRKLHCIVRCTEKTKCLKFETNIPMKRNIAATVPISTFMCL